MRDPKLAHILVCHISNALKKCNHVLGTLLSPLACSHQNLPRSRIQMWLYDQKNLRIEGHIIGFDEYMNLVLDDAEEVGFYAFYHFPFLVINTSLTIFVALVLVTYNFPASFFKLDLSLLMVTDKMATSDPSYTSTIKILFLQVSCNPFLISGASQEAGEEECWADSHQRRQHNPYTKRQPVIITHHVPSAGHADCPEEH